MRVCGLLHEVSPADLHPLVSCIAEGAPGSGAAGPGGNSSPTGHMLRAARGVRWAGHHSLFPGVPAALRHPSRLWTYNASGMCVVRASTRVLTLQPACGACVTVCYPSPPVSTTVSVHPLPLPLSLCCVSHISDCRHGAHLYHHGRVALGAVWRRGDRVWDLPIPRLQVLQCVQPTATCPSTCIQSTLGARHVHSVSNSIVCLLPLPRTSPLATRCRCVTAVDTRAPF